MANLKITKEGRLSDREKSRVEKQIANNTFGSLILSEEDLLDDKESIYKNNLDNENGNFIDYILNARDKYRLKRNEFNELIQKTLNIANYSGEFNSSMIMGGSSDEESEDIAACIKLNHINSLHKCYIKYDKVAIDNIVVLREKVYDSIKYALDEIFLKKENEKMVLKINNNFFTSKDSKIHYFISSLFAIPGENSGYVDELREIFLQASLEFRKTKEYTLNKDYLNGIIILYHTITDGRFSDKDMKIFFECAGDDGIYEAIYDLFLAAHSNHFKEDDRAKEEHKKYNTMKSINMNKNLSVNKLITD